VLLRFSVRNRVLVLAPAVTPKRCSLLLKSALGEFSSFLGNLEFRSLSFGNSRSLEILLSPFHLEDTSPSTLPLSNLTQILSDWWADRIGVLVLALRFIPGRTALEFVSPTANCCRVRALLRHSQMRPNAAVAFGTVPRVRAL
jgi:hypothetical protein